MAIRFLHIRDRSGVTSIILKVFKNLYIVYIFEEIQTLKFVANMKKQIQFVFYYLFITILLLGCSKSNSITEIEDNYKDSEHTFVSFSQASSIAKSLLQF